MELSVFSGRANPKLAAETASALGVESGGCLLEDFPDGELRVEIEACVRGHDVYLIQPTSPPIAGHLLELLLMADACRRAGASRITAVMPYFGYARQDRRSQGREPVAAQVIAEVLSARLSRVITVDLHTPTIAGFFSIPAEPLTAIPALAEALRPELPADAIIVAPDLGAVKVAQRYADRLDLPVAYLHKVRLSGEEVSVRGVVGEVAGRAPIVVDDMISTGGTMISAIEALVDRNCRPAVTVVATHGLFVGDAAQRFASLPVGKILVTDSVRPAAVARLPLEVIGLAEMLAGAIRSLHEDRSIGHQQRQW